MKSASIFIEKKYIKFQLVNAKNALARKLRRKADAKVSPSITELLTSSLTLGQKTHCISGIMVPILFVKRIITSFCGNKSGFGGNI